MLEEFLQNSATGLPPESVWTIVIAIVAGVIASAVCPCTLPVGLGMAGLAGASDTQARRNGFSIAAAVFAGIVVNLTILGALAARLGAILTESFGKYWTLGMAVLSLGAAIFAFWGPRLKSSQLAAMRTPGVGGAFAYGFIFSLGTSASPLLVLLTVAAAHAGSSYCVVLSFSFGLGRGLPFLLAGLFAGAVTRLTRLGSWHQVLQFTTGTTLLFVTLYYVRAFAGLL
jgi:cytochrome c-type biogenesis protein